MTTRNVSLYASRASNYDTATTRTISALLLMHNIKVVTHVLNGNNTIGFIIVEAPYAMGKPYSGKWFMLSDNGGEVQVGLINQSTADAWFVETGVPFTHFSGEPVTAETMAYRIACVMRGEPIDWQFEAPGLGAWVPVLGDPLPIVPKSLTLA